MSTNTNPLFSIIVPIYNVEKYLRKSLGSIINQSNSNWEAICIDDGSTDNSKYILNLYAKQCNKIKIISQKNSGPAHARNVGIDNANGDYILFLDSDDELSEDTIKILTNEIKKCTKAPDIVVYGASFSPKNQKNEWLERALNTSNKFYSKFSSDILFKENGTHPFIWMNAIKRDFLNKNKLRINENLDLGEDQLFQFSFFPLSNGVLFINNQLYKYNASRNDSLMSKYYLMPHLKIEKHIQQIDLLLQTAINQKNNNEMYILELIDWIINFVSYDVINNPEPYYRRFFATKIIDTINKYHPLTKEEVSFLFSSDLYNKLIELSEKNLEEEYILKKKVIEDEIKYIDLLIADIKHSNKYKIGKLIYKIKRK